MVKQVKKTLFVLAILVASVFCTANFVTDKSMKVVPIGQNPIIENIDSVADADNPEVSVEADFDKGSVTGGGRYAVGDKVELVATANDGCYFVKWQTKVGEEYQDLIVDGELVAKSSYSFVMNGDVSFLAVFDFLPYTISSNFTNYFNLTDFNYSYDTTRFDNNNLPNYIRANKDNALVDGKVYYNDIVTMQFDNIENKYVKKLNTNNFSFNTKPIATICVNSDGILMSVEINRTTVDYEDQNKMLADAIADGSIVFDYDNYTYIVLTQRKVSDNYTTTHIELRYKVTQNANFNMTASELYVLTISAIDESQTPLDINDEKLSSLVIFDYGYFGALDLTGTTRNYLIENGANYSFTFESNQFYTYLGGEWGTTFTESNKRGYFNKDYTQLTLFFKRMQYEVSFEEYVRIDSRVIAMTNPWYNLPTQEVFPGQTVTFDIVNKSFEIDGVTSSFEPQNLYGYKLFAVGSDKTIDTETLSPYSATIDENNPENIVVYIIHKQIDYNLHIGVVDKNGYENAYLKSKISYMTFDKTINAGDSIVLTGDANTGFQLLGWKSFDNVINDENRESFLNQQYLNTLNFKFQPTSNVNVDLYYYLVADYEYRTLKYTLDESSFDNGNSMATLGLGIVDYFTFDETTGTLKVFGKSVMDNTINSTELLSKTLNAPQEVDKGNGKIVYTYSTPIGDIEITKINGENTSLLFASHTYLFDTDKFTKDTTVPVEYNVNYLLGGTDYSIEINKTCDDVVLCFAKNNNFGDYKFTQYTIDKASSLMSMTLGDSTELGDYAYVCSSNQSIELVVVFSFRTQNITVSIQGEGYSIDDVDAKVNGVTDNVAFDGLSKIIISAENGNIILITVDTQNVELGYRYDNMITNYAELHPEGIKTPQITKTSGLSGDVYTMELTMTSEYAYMDIVICFVEINYTVAVVDLSNKGLDAQYSPDSTMETSPIEDGKFIVNWTISRATPYILVSSARGYFISKAYIGVDDADHSLNEFLQGQESEQTKNKKFEITDFTKYILENADADNVVTIYIEQTERTYSITITYKLKEKTTTQNTQYATITSSLGTTKKATQYGTEWQVVFDKIAYGTSNIGLTMSADAVSGIKFDSWCTVSNGTPESVSTALTYTITSVEDNLHYVALFECIQYTIEYKYVYEIASQKYKEYDSSEYSSIGEVSSNLNKFTVGDTIKFSVNSKAGYQYLDLYYGYLINKQELQNGNLVYVYTSKEGIIEDNGEYRIDVSSNAPNTGFNNLLTFKGSDWSNKELQLTNENYRKLVIYLIFAEKTYGVTVEAENIGDSNTTNIDVSDWIDKDSLSIKYRTSTANDYEQNTDANPTYRTNTYIEVRFKASFAGINLYNIYIGSEDFRVAFNDNIPEHELAGQTISLALYEDIYVLTFQLNTTLLEKVQDDLTIFVRYEIKKYKIKFSARNANGVLENFGLKISYDEPMGGLVSDNNDSFIYSNASYGYDLGCSVNLENAKDYNFNKKYYFVYFKVNDIELQIHTSDEEPQNAYSIKFLTKFNTNEFTDMNIWEMNANASQITVIAMFAPKISLNGFEQDGLTYTRIVGYNSKEQRLTTAYDKRNNGEAEDTADIVYDVGEFGQIVINYVNSAGKNTDPINADKYTITLNISGYTFEGKIYLIITRAKVTLKYTGQTVRKTYDGTTNITQANINYLSASFDLDGIQENDKYLDKFNFSTEGSWSVSGEYEDKMVGVNKTVKVNGIRLSNELRKNYEFDTKINDTDYFITNTQLAGKGEITPRTVTIDTSLFHFEDIVYKDDEEYKLKYNVDYDKEIDGQKVIQNGRILVTGAVGGDEVYISFDGDVNSIDFVLDDYSVGRNKRVSLNIDTSLAGADSKNYIIQDVVYYIDIYPYMLKYTKENVGTFVIVDKDEKCLIPIELYGYESFEVEYIDSTNPDYPNYYVVMEDNLAKDERLHAFYKIHIYSQYGLELNISRLKNCYFRMPKVKNTKNIYEIENNDYNGVQYSGGDSYFEIKIGNDSKPTLSLVVDKTYFSIWRIIIIVGALLLLLLVIILIILILKRKRQKENESKEKI